MQRPAGHGVPNVYELSPELVELREHPHGPGTLWKPPKRLLTIV